MPTDLVQANFAGATPGSDLAAFVPTVGSGFARHPTNPNAALVFTANHLLRAGTAGSNTVYTNQTISGSADYSVRVKVRMINLTGTDIAGPLVRTSATIDQFYTLGWFAYNGFGSGLALFKHVNGNASQVGSFVATVNGASVIPTNGAEAVLELAVAGSTLTGSINGTVAITANDPDLTDVGLGGLFLHAGQADDGQGFQVEEFDLSGVAPSSGGGGTGTQPSPASVTLGVAGPGFWASPLNWDDDGTAVRQGNGVRGGASTVWTTANGAEGRFSWTTPVTSNNVAQLLIDTSPLAAGSVGADQYPKIKYRVNDGPYRVAQVPAGTNGLATLDLTGAGISAAGTYTVRVTLMASSQAVGRWQAASNLVMPPNCLKINGLVVDAGSTPVAPPALAKSLVVFGDSITEGVQATGTNNGDLNSNDATLAFGRALAVGLGAELGAIGYGSQGWLRSTPAGVPPLPAAFAFQSAGRTRDFFTPVDYVVCAHGTNDGLNNVADADVTNAVVGWLQAARGKFGAATRIILCVPFGGFKRTAITLGFNQYQAATPDPLAFLVDGGPALQAGLTGFIAGGTWAGPGDGVHPDSATHARIAATLVDAIGADSNVGGIPTTPNDRFHASGTTFEQLRAGGLSGQIGALILANPSLSTSVVAGLHAGQMGTLDRTYQAVAGLVESYLRGDPVDSAEINGRLGDYAQVFAGLARSTAEVATLVADNPGNLGVLAPQPHAINAVAIRSFAN